jgi:hypothetical protein
MKRVAYLNNHNTAAPFVVETMAALGAETYLPLVCPERGALSGPAAAQLRTARLEPKEQTLLDVVDWYNEALTVDVRVLACLDSLFDVVIIPAAVRTPNLRVTAHLLSTRVIVFEWGDIMGITTHAEYDAAVARANVRRAVAYQRLGADLLHLPLGLPRGIAAALARSDAVRQSDTVIIAVSRLWARYSRTQLLELLEAIHAPSFHLLIVGKDHGDTSFLQRYTSRWQSITARADQPVEALYRSYKQSAALLYWMREPTVLQYSALECITLGTPVIYYAQSLLSAVMPAADPCRVTAPAEMPTMLDALRDEATARAISLQQLQGVNALLADIPEKWSRIFW